MFDEVKPVHRKEYAHYSISVNGDVVNTRTGLTLKPWPDVNGYPTVALSTEGKRWRVHNHKLVVEAFVPPDATRSKIHHIDGDKTNNVTTNLLRVTQKENIHYSLREHGFSPCMQQVPVVAYNPTTHHKLRFVSMSCCAQELGSIVQTVSKAVAYPKRKVHGYHITRE